MDAAPFLLWKAPQCNRHEQVPLRYAVQPSIIEQTLTLSEPTTTQSRLRQQQSQAQPERGSGGAPKLARGQVRVARSNTRALVVLTGEVRGHSEPLKILSFEPHLKIAGRQLGICLPQPCWPNRPLPRSSPRWRP